MTRALRAELLLVMMTVIWGGTFVVIKTGLTDASPLLFLSLRFGVALLIGCAIWLVPLRRALSRRLTRRTVVHGVVLGVLMFGGYGSQTFGLQYTTVAKSSLFTYSFALLTPLLQYLIARKRLAAGNLAGLAVVVAGMYLFASPAAGSLNLGDWATLGGAAVFAFYIVYLDRYSSEGDPVILTLLQFATTAALALVSSLVLERPRVDWNGHLFFAIGYLSILGSVVAVYVMSRFQKDTTPTKAVILYALEPIFSVAFGCLLLKEALDLKMIAGGLLILAGVLTSELWAPGRRHPLEKSRGESLQ